MQAAVLGLHVAQIGFRRPHQPVAQDGPLHGQIQQVIVLGFVSQCTKNSHEDSMTPR